jgi:hypothetical protein
MMEGSRIFILTSAVSGSFLVALLVVVVLLNQPQELTLIPNYSYCNFSDLYKSYTARLYMAELVANATANCGHLSCAQNLTGRVPG